MMMEFTKTILLVERLVLPNENMRFSLFGEGNDYEWSLTADNSVSKDDAMVSEAIICERDSTTCTNSQKALIQPTIFAHNSGLDIFVTDFATSAPYIGAYMAANGGAAGTACTIRCSCLKVK